MEACGLVKRNSVGRGCSMALKEESADCVIRVVCQEGEEGAADWGVPWVDRGFRLGRGGLLVLRGGWGIDNDKHYQTLGLNRDAFPSQVDLGVSVLARELAGIVMFAPDLVEYVWLQHVRHLQSYAFPQNHPLAPTYLRRMRLRGLTRSRR